MSLSPLPSSSVVHRQEYQRLAEMTANAPPCLPVLAPRPPDLKPPEPPPKPHPREHSEAEWETHRALLGQLYLQENRKLCDIMTLLANRYGFAATEQMYKKRFKKWHFRKRQYRKKVQTPQETSLPVSPAPSGLSMQEDGDVEQIVVRQESPDLAVSISPVFSPQVFVALETVLGSASSWSHVQLETFQVQLDPMSEYLAAPDHPPVQDSRTMYRTFELIYELFRHNQGELAGRAARKACVLLEFVLRGDHPDLLWHILDTVYDMIAHDHITLLGIFLTQAHELTKRLLPALHPLPRILQQLIRCDYQTIEARKNVMRVLKKAWLRNVELLGAEIGSASPRRIWLYEQLIWDGRTPLRKDSNLHRKRDEIYQALEGLANGRSPEEFADDPTSLRVDALLLEFTQMDLGDKEKAEDLAKRLLRNTEHNTNRPLEARFHAYARKMLSRIYESRHDWEQAEENLKWAVVKREEAHGAGNNLRVIRDMWVLAGYYQRAGRLLDAQEITNDAIRRAEQFLGTDPVL